MPQIDINNHSSNYLLEDFGHAETLIFSNSLGTDLTLWDSVMPYIQDHFNVLRYDTRGHGKSSVGTDTEYTIEQLGQDVIALLDHLKLDKVHFCGISMGGLIGQWLGINASNRFENIVICNSAAKIGTVEGWNNRIKQVAVNGLESITDGTLERWFTPQFREKHPEKAQNIINTFVSNPVQGYVACCAAIRDADFTKQLHELEVPTLIISGIKDEVTTVEDGSYFMKHIPVCSHIKLYAAHLSNIECDLEFSKHVAFFLMDH